MSNNTPAPDPFPPLDPTERFVIACSDPQGEAVYDVGPGSGFPTYYTHLEDAVAACDTHQDREPSHSGRAFRVYDRKTGRILYRREAAIAIPITEAPLATPNIPVPGAAEMAAIRARADQIDRELNDPLYEGRTSLADFEYVDDVRAVLAALDALTWERDMLSDAAADMALTLARVTAERDALRAGREGGDTASEPTP